MIGLRSLTLVLTAVCAAGSAVGAQQVALPEGCEAYVSMQKRSCTVSHIFQCANDPEGYQRRVDFNQEGMTYLGIIDAEAQWIESFSPARGETTRLMAGALDPASLTELLATGGDTFEFFTNGDVNGATQYIGEDQLTGETETIDGVDVLVTSFVVQIERSNGDIETVQGNEYVHPEWRTFLSGVRTFTTASGEKITQDHRPVDFIFPGEGGFLSMTPIYDCGASLSKAVRS